MHLGKSIQRLVLPVAVVMLSSFSNNHSEKMEENDGYTVFITITNVRNKKGRIQLQLYKDHASFSEQKPFKELHISKSSMSGNTLKYRLTGLPKGTYGMALLDDEDKDGEMDYSWMMPSEGFGFSNYVHASWSKPHFNDFKFNLNEDKKVTMKIRYM